MKSARAISEVFCLKLRHEKRRNTLCISSFSWRKVGAKDLLRAEADFFRVSFGYLSIFQETGSYE